MESERVVVTGREEGEGLQEVRASPRAKFVPGMGSLGVSSSIVESSGPVQARALLKWILDHEGVVEMEGTVYSTPRVRRISIFFFPFLWTPTLFNSCNCWEWRGTSR